MKKILGLTAMAVFVAGVAAAEVTTPAPNAATSTTAVTTDWKVKATETCQKKGLAGALLDECVKNEVAKNTATTTKTAPAATGTTSTTHP